MAAHSNFDEKALAPFEGSSTADTRVALPQASDLPRAQTVYLKATQVGITGESMPVEKTAGATVFAGSINQSGALEVRADRIGRDTSYGKIIERLSVPSVSRAPVQRLADRLAGYLVYFALGAAALTYLITHNPR